MLKVRREVWRTTETRDGARLKAVYVGDTWVPMDLPLSWEEEHAVSCGGDFLVTPRNYDPNRDIRRED